MRRGSTARRRLQMFRYILLPHLLPYMLIAASFRAIAAMGDFDKIWLLTGGGPGDRTTTITIYTYQTGFSAFDIGRTAAIAWIFVVIVMVVSSPLLCHLFRRRRPTDDARADGARRSQIKVALTALWCVIAFVYLVPVSLDGADRHPPPGRHAGDALHLHADAGRRSARSSARCGFQALSAQQRPRRDRRRRCWCSRSPRPPPTR